MLLVSHLACIIPKHDYFPPHHAMALMLLHFKRVRCDNETWGHVNIISNFD